MCFSDNYVGLLYTRHKNRPNEKKIIEYSTKLFKTGRISSSNTSAERSFLNPPRPKRIFFKRNSPFDEIRKYDIYHWGDPYRIRPIVRIQCAKEATLPKGDRDLFGYYTSDYGNPIFTTEMKKGVYGPPDCPYEQLGVDRTNPRNITRCYYSQNQGISNTRSVYLEVEYKPFTQPFSFYNTAPFINDKNQQFYPCGTNWRGRVDKEKPMDKYTILLSGKTMPPKDYKLIWNSVNGCEGCMLPENEISIWDLLPRKALYPLETSLFGESINPPLIWSAPYQNTRCGQNISIRYGALMDFKSNNSNQTAPWTAAVR